MRFKKKIILILIYPILYILFYYDSIITFSLKNKIKGFWYDLTTTKKYELTSSNFDMKSDLIVFLHIPKTGEHY